MKQPKDKDVFYPFPISIRITADEFDGGNLVIERKGMNLKEASNFMQAVPKIMGLLHIEQYDRSNIEADNAAHGL
jgi:hypothetical protein